MKQFLRNADAVSRDPLYAQNHVRIPFVRRHNLTGTSLVASDRARARFLQTRHTRVASPGTGVSGPSIGVDVTNTVVSYIAEVLVGSPPQTFNLIVDTGSSNTAVGTGKHYVKTSSSRRDTGTSVVSPFVFIGPSMRKRKQP